MSDKTAKKIMVVEDEQYLRELYVQILQQEGYVVDIAEDGEQALAKLTQNEYDLILLDVILPKMDGLQILEKLSKMGKKNFNNTVLLTNLGQDLVVAKALDYGVRGYMVKSDFTPEELIKEVKGYLENGIVRSAL
ncbi:MAG: Two-component response regulator [Candidatus Roizmanbacteria bacterium GW2011_GWA2_37_7]|uniref:Two-component response regulator n=1 Tax=Candidatus Roizmanbacteria bacterium GW2011_GWA2_37_7 TaxID=1618481 RepID=A0A0G0HGQ8_9BACT|nr:MAG: Two-component response regulator [Candidatus Roizmanbacteria bacterium GW2011_GWA2_37_7]